MSLLQSQRLRLLEKFVHGAERLALRFHGSSAGPEHLAVGRRGEEAAYFHLRRRGYTVVARGWRSTKLRGDLDLIAWDGPILCFIEVKTRTGRSIATAESAVDEEKIRMLRRMAGHYLRTMPKPPAETRFDILSVYLENSKPPEFDHFQGAFGWYRSR